MPIYHTKCVGPEGATFWQDIEAPSVASLRQIVEGQKNFLLRYDEKVENTGSHRQKLSMTTLAAIFDLLALQLENRVHQQTAIKKLMGEFPKKKARAVLRGMHGVLARAEATLSEAMALYPRTFPPAVVSVVRVGETAGGEVLARRFAELRDQYNFRLSVRETTIKAATYPIFILVMACALVGIIMVKVIPQMKELFDALTVPLPSLTLFVLHSSDFCASHWLALLGLAVLAIAGLQMLRQAPRTAQVCDHLFLRLPVIGTIARQLITAEVAKTYGDLYRAGADANSTMDACADVVSNRAFKAALLRARKLLETGAAGGADPNALVITEALRSTGYFPELALTIIATGEESGSLAKALDRVSDFYADNAKKQISVALAIFKVAIMLVLAAIVGTIIIALWLPILTLSRHIH